VRVKTLLIWGLVLSLAVVWLVLSKWDALTGTAAPAGAAGDVAGLPAAPPAAPDETQPDRLEQRWTELVGSAPAWPSDLRAPKDCSAIEEDLERLCRELDTRPYVREAIKAGGTCELLQQVAEALAEHPPQLDSELRSYEVMLDNAFHLFRTVGRKRLEVLRRILHEEQELAEPLAMALYRWLASREACAGEQRTEIRLARLYEYAGFLFQTLGGQAYLRRRTPRVESLASFYALLLLDRAIEGRQNPHGIDPRPELVRCRELLAAQPLVFGERYRALLDDLSRRWEDRGGRFDGGR
jgi:hypothetical protein